MFDYPIIGAGGGGWSSLYQQYQSYPYTSRQAHNFLLQYLTEIGLLGILAIVFFILFIFIRYIKNII
ncbi:hypothetical protein EXW96_22790 [Paenibacillus sp. JMULE4]|nr:hypothetical protein [Paenibacillus sp. JMULE4]